VISICGEMKNGNLKDKVYSNNPHTLAELKQSIRETISSIEVNELKLV
jgi:hypothetical protein